VQINDDSNTLRCLLTELGAKRHSAVYQDLEMSGR